MRMTTGSSGNVGTRAWMFAAVAAALSSAGFAADAPKPQPASPAPPESVVVFIGNRLFPDFREIVSTGLHEKRQVGDTDFYFEVTRFLPHFTIIDSTKQVVSLSDEPKNPAFRILVYENDAAVDSSWAFFNLSIPHFNRKSALWFQVIAFDYRGKAFKKEAPEPGPVTPQKPKGHP